MPPALQLHYKMNSICIGAASLALKLCRWHMKPGKIYLGSKEVYFGS